MHEKLPTTSMIAIVTMAATLLISCSEDTPNSSSKHQLPPAGQPTSDAAPSASPSAIPTPTVVKKEKVVLDPRVPTLVYSEMESNIKLGWDVVDGPISDYKHATWPGECAADDVAQCKETYYGQWCQDSCENLWGVVELVTGDICARKTDVKLCSEW